MSETTSTTDEPTEQPGDGTAVNPVDAPTVVDEPTTEPTTEPTPGSTEEPVEQPAGFAPTEEEWDALTKRVAELEDRATDPEEPTTPTTPASTHDERLVEWDDHDEWGNPRVFYGVDLGPDPYDEDKHRVARLVPGVTGYDPARLRPLGS